MSEKKKKEAAIKILRGLSDWDPAEACSFETSDGAEFRVGPMSCITVNRKHRLLILGVDYTQEMSDLFGLGMRGENRDGVAFQTFTSQPERELADWTLSSIVGRVPKPPEDSEDRIDQAILSGLRKAPLLRAAAEMIGRSSSKSPDGEQMRSLVHLMSENGADFQSWALNRMSFERAVMRRSEADCLAFFEQAGSASRRTLMDLARLTRAADGLFWLNKENQCQALVLKMADWGCALSDKTDRAADLFERAGMGAVAAVLEARELRQSIAQGAAPAKISLSL